MSQAISQTIGFVGAGQMARALAAGLARSGLVAAGKIVASDAVGAALDEFTRLVPGSRRAASNAEVVAQADIIWLAVKPQQLPAVLAELQPAASETKLFVSIAAGVRLATLAQNLGGKARLVRVMPNTPCLVGQSASAYALGQNATADDGKLVGRMLQAVGKALPVEEKLLDAVTGLSGSGPAFVYLVIEALADGGVRMGLPRDAALTLAAQTVRGAAEMVLATGEHPGVLKDRVASPGGTTIAGLQVLEAQAVRGALMAAVEAAARRSVELGSLYN